VVTVRDSSLVELLAAAVGASRIAIRRIAIIFIVDEHAWREYKLAPDAGNSLFDPFFFIPFQPLKYSSPPNAGNVSFSLHHQVFPRNES